MSDLALMDWAALKVRAIATYNTSDFLPLAEERQSAGVPIAGLLLISPKTSPGARGHGLLIRALETILEDRPSLNALVDQVVWLAKD